MISILLPAYKSDELLQKVFYPSWLKNTECKTELILYDNGGNDVFIRSLLGSGCSEISFTLEVDDKHTLKIIGADKSENIGLNPALNAAAEHAEGDWLYLPHTDMHLMPKWDTGLLRASKGQVPWKILLCSRSIEKHSHIPEQLLMDFGTDLASFDEVNLYKFFKHYNDKSITVNARMPFFLHKKLWDKMGGVEEALFSFATDDDLIQEAYDAGVRQFWMCHESVVYHLSGHTNKQQSVDRDDMKPYEFFIEKWKERGYTDAKHPAHWHPQLMGFGTKIK